MDVIFGFCLLDCSVAYQKMARNFELPKDLVLL